jgi:hypothetical protein
MIRIHATKKLFDYLDLPAFQPRDLEHPVVGAWHADLMTLKRKKHLIFCHDDSRMVVVIANITKASLKTLSEQFMDVLVNSLLKSKIELVLIETLAVSLKESQLYFDTETNRSVQGTLRLRKQDLELMVELDQTTVEEMPESWVSYRLSDVPCSTKKSGQSLNFWPNYVLGFNLKRAYDYDSCSTVLTLDCIPSSVHMDADFLQFAETFDGYGFVAQSVGGKRDAGQSSLNGLQELGKTARAEYKRNWKLPKELNTLRAVLFYEYCNNHFTNIGDSSFKTPYIIKLVDEIRRRFRHGDGV